MYKLKSKILFTLTSLVLVVLFQNCGAPESKKDGASSQSIQEKSNFTWINENIIKPQCVECHNSSLAFSGLEFTSYNGVMDAVIPGQPASSSFYSRSFTTTFFELTDEERDIIYTWILEGAANN